MRYSDSAASFDAGRAGSVRSGSATVVVAVVAAACGWRLSAAAGDEIVVGSTTFKQVRIVDLEGGDIAYRTPSGAFRRAPLAAVDRVRVDSLGTLGDLNEAEDRLAKGDFVRATVHYERAIRLSSGFWRRLVRARYVQACDRGDQIDTVAQQFAAILRDETTGPPLAAELLPVTAPSTGSRGVRRALRRIADVIERVSSQSARVLLELLRFQIVNRSGEGDAAALAGELVKQPIPPIIGTRAVYRAKREALAVLLDRGALTTVLEAAQDDLESAPQEVLPELLLVKARALLASAKDDKTAIRAGWAAMRIVIHYPHDALVPEALLLAARVHEHIGRVPTALKLLDECVRQDQVSAAIRTEATELAGRLRSAG